MDDKDSEQDVHISRTADNDEEMFLEEAVTAVTLRSSVRRTSSTNSTLSNDCTRIYSNSHHTEVRRSTDNREEDLLLEFDENPRIRRQQYCTFSDSLVRMPESLAQTTSFEKREEHEFSRQPSSRSQQDEPLESIAQPLGEISLQSSTTSTPQQESCGRHFDDPSDGRLENDTQQRRGGLVDVERIQNQESKFCTIVLFKRGIIARDELVHVLYIIPYDDFQKKFPKIKQYEAVVCHGTEFPTGEANQPMLESLLYHHILITGIVTVQFELVRGENFTVVCPSMTTSHVSKICSRSVDRIGCGFSVTVLTRCTGGKDKLFQDSIRMTLQTGNTTLHLVFPIAYYEANVSPWLYDSNAVTAMPKEDREVLRSCHVSLLENIGDVISLCEHLYQHKILDGDDLDEIRNIPRKKDRNAHVLRTIQTRGNILDLVIEIMRGKRENQEAAAILQRKRFRFQPNDM